MRKLVNYRNARHCNTHYRTKTNQINTLWYFAIRITRSIFLYVDFSKILINKFWNWIKPLIAMFVLEVYSTLDAVLKFHASINVYLKLEVKVFFLIS